VHFDAGVVREEVNGKIFPERHEAVQVVFSTITSSQGKTLWNILTINVPLFKKLWDIIFFAGQSLYEPFQGTF
jgi:hypothetical protein